MPAIRPAHVPEPPAQIGDELLGRFSGELAALGVELHIETSADAVRARVQSIIGSQRVFSWDAAFLPYDIGSLPLHVIYGTASRDEQAAAEIGLTACDAAIAETGTLALLAGAGRPRAASLLPPIHVAVVRRGDLRFGMAEYFRDRAGAIAAASSCMMITGPSRTADIELTLTVGVHGPGKVIVVVGP
jgi:L-lactate dehydrogenase complex protein LldG